MRTLFLALAMVSLSATPSLAAPCKDAKGKFVKCPDKKPPAATRCKDAKGKFMKCPDKKPAAPVKCKDAKGKFAKCGTPGAKPA
ncbi:hypothetical protein [Sphingomonas sp.]|uniref:hypothetical protein n=1 Tax=Sphingomonas sp. TaxID=28214 RepID=UPI0025E3DB02|nr:hypothetical protein [Sphingomonas sp.]